MQIIVALILIMLYALGWLLVIVVGGIASLVEHIMKKRAADKARESRKAKVAGALRENTGQTGHSDREPSREKDQATPAPNRKDIPKVTLIRQSLPHLWPRVR